MTKIEQIAKASTSAAFKKRNPHLFTPMARLATATAMLDSGPGMIRQSSKPLMNRLETEFYHELQLAGWKVILCQSLKFRLGNGVWYSPDFIAIQEFNQMMTAYEVKGFMRDDAAVKLKVAAGMYPWISWRLAYRKKGEWVYQLVS